MILAFADDSTVTAVDDIAEANGYCEGVDVEAGIFTFVDEHGTVLRPVFTQPVTRSTLGPVSFVSSGPRFVTAAFNPVSLNLAVACLAIIDLLMLSFKEK